MLFVSGSIAYDTIISTVGTFDSNRRGNDIHYSYSLYSPSIARQSGGTGHNVAYTLGLLWAKELTCLVGAVWNDFVPSRKQQDLIDYSHVITDNEAMTAHAFMVNDEQQHQIIVFHPGAMASGLHTIPNEKFQYALITPNDKEIMISHVKLTKASGATVFFDPGQALGLFSKEDIHNLASYVDYLICNEEEALTICKLFDYKNMTDIELLFWAAIITKWADGLTFKEYNSKERVTLSAIPAPQVVDPTGAGDSLRWWMLQGLISWKSLQESLQQWILTAWYCVQHQWPQAHFYTKEEFDKNYALHFEG